ncbi:Os03g0670900 [Oryza sativa Japonica Group]|uniref:Os03g0670900 protein n=1 Tax=Oryza sativa subsp. japonica TaxID=39947 RepID=A0A0P0W213_ORYSJ|nr:Os03g0670900 [Oryza sativa Japonica Group]
MRPAVTTAAEMEKSGRRLHRRYLKGDKVVALLPDGRFLPPFSPSAAGRQPPAISFLRALAGRPGNSRREEGCQEGKGRRQKDVGREREHEVVVALLPHGRRPPPFSPPVIGRRPSLSTCAHRQARELGEGGRMPGGRGEKGDGRIHRRRSKGHEVFVT